MYIYIIYISYSIYVYILHIIFYIFVYLYTDVKTSTRSSPHSVHSLFFFQKYKENNLENSLV